MSSAPIHLDWRNAPSKDEVISKILDLLSEIDQKSRGKMVLSGTMTGVNGAQLKYVDKDGNVLEDDSTEPSTRMFVFDKKSTNKSAVNYLLKLAVIAQRILQDIDKGVPVPHRLFGYYWTHKSLSRDLAFSLATDIALTVGLHPFLLGVVPETAGKFALPIDWAIHFKTCENILDRDASGSLILNNSKISGPCADATIPSLIHSLEVRNIQNKITEVIKAVLVFEHRNIKFILNSLVKKEDPRFKNVIFISTGGFPDRGTREFLKLLMAQEKMKGVPCIYISDRDPHAMEIFSVLKYGSRFNAFESRITAVNEIQWGGVSIKRYKQIAGEWPETALQDYNKRNPQSSEADREKELKRLQKMTKETMIKSLRQPSALLNPADKNRLKHFFNFKNFSTEHEPELYEDLIAMGMNPLGSRTAINRKAVGEKFGLAKLCQHDQFGIENCVAAIMSEIVVATVASGVANPLLTASLKRAWDASRVSSEPVAIKRVRDQEDNVMSSSGTVEAMESSGTVEAMQSSGTVEQSRAQSSLENLSVVSSEDQTWDWEEILEVQ